MDLRNMYNDNMCDDDDDDDDYYDYDDANVLMLIMSSVISKHPW